MNTFASSQGFRSLEEYQSTMTQAREIIDIPHHIVFTHGDLKAHNVLVDENCYLLYFLTGSVLADAPSTGTLRLQ